MKNSKIKWGVLAAFAMASFLLATGGVAGDDRKPPASRIVGGDEALPGEFPFMVALDKPRGVCGCSIIDKWHVLTAAHCVTLNTTNEPLDPRDLKVKVGCHLRTEFSSIHAVSRVMVHHAWDTKSISNENDIAVLELEKEIEFNSLSGLGAFGCIDLAPSEDLCCDKSAEELTAIVWGLLEGHESIAYQGPLMKVELDSDTLEDCNKHHEAIGNSDKFICTRTSGRNTCRGDSGGPLIRRSTWARPILVGVTSFGNEYCDSNAGGVFTKVSAFRDWIEQCTDDGTCQAL